MTCLEPGIHWLRIITGNQPLEVSHDLPENSCVLMFRAVLRIPYNIKNTKTGIKHYRFFYSRIYINSPLTAWFLGKHFSACCWVQYSIMYYFCSHTYISNNYDKLLKKIRYLGLKLGIFVIQPVPIPSAPFTSTIGRIGMYLCSI